MSLQPLINAPAAIQVHAVAAALAFALGLVQLAAPKGTVPHKSLGWLWVGLMVIVSASAFFVHEIRLWGRWSPIHLLAVMTLVLLPSAVWHARRHDIVRHRRAMLGLFCGALLIAGAFTLVPGRIIHAMLFGR